MGSIVIFRISSCPPLFVVYQYHTCNWFYFSYFLLYGRVKATGLQNRRQIGKHNKEKAAIFGYAAFLIYVSMINHKSEIPQYRFSIEAPEK